MQHNRAELRNSECRENMMQGVYKKNLIKISTFFASVLESDLMLGK